jgi:hypothetical protein
MKAPIFFRPVNGARYSPSKRQRATLSFDDEAADPPLLPPLTPTERRAFDYSALEEAMADLDAIVCQIRHNFGARLRAGV